VTGKINAWFRLYNQKKELTESIRQLHLLLLHLEQERENEKVAVSYDLHENLGQVLAVIKIDLGIIKQKVSGIEVISEINKASDLVSETIKTVRRLTSQLHPQILDDLGLEAAIDWYTKDFTHRTGVAVNFNSDTGISFSPDASLSIFRIVQECFNNIARHSGASRVEVRLEKAGESVYLRISDNGTGITDSQIQSEKSFGIKGIKERSVLLGGSFTFCLANENATVAELRIPLIPEE